MSDNEGRSRPVRPGESHDNDVNELLRQTELGWWQDSRMFGVINRSQPSLSISFALAVASAALVLFGTAYFASLRPEYRHLVHTISELGEFGATHSAVVSFGVFLPAGLLAWTALFIRYWFNERRQALTLGLLAFACLDIGYVGAAFFPCDPGSPLLASWRQQTHNVFGFIEYCGTGLGLLLLGWHALRYDHTLIGVLLVASALVVLGCLALLSLPSVFSIRGAVQRVAEATMFVWLCVLCHPSLIAKMTPDRSSKRTRTGDIRARQTAGGAPCASSGSLIAARRTALPESGNDLEQERRYV